ncbi:hypothetical protein HZH68_011482 [Vespula germanica]|uniref:Uncharacterized protein n=1 Tax=Vespula germanica TaxID=30212 RepID=A0A834N1U9_VESGE|nr:hypothetical protein HZH68_011482 [Vespula germanica]
MWIEDGSRAKLPRSNDINPEVADISCITRPCVPEPVITCRDENTRLDLAQSRSFRIEMMDNDGNFSAFFGSIRPMEYKRANQAL